MSRTRRPLALAAGLGLLAGACSSVPSNSGAGEMMHVQGGQFFEGAFPQDGGQYKVISVGARNGMPAFAADNKAFSGDADLGASSVAIGLEGMSDGYWVVPIGALDPNVENAASFDAVLDFSTTIAPGAHDLLFAAGDGRGKFGPVKPLQLTFGDPLPAGSVVASLSWSNKADLDLHLVGPSGKELDPKHPNTAEVPDKGLPDGGIPGNGALDRDANAACVQDGTHREDVVWQDAPEAGTYLVRVDLFSACTEPASNFVFALYVGGQLVFQRAGRLLDIDADDGTGPGLFVAYFTCTESGTCS